MPDNLTPEDRRKTMRAVKGKGTSLERCLFAMLAGMRLRGWKQNPTDVIGKPDVVFSERRIAIFVDGCFWHACPYCNRPFPKTNRQYWERKIERNVRRDQKVDEELQAQGWTVLRIWEHEMKDESRRPALRAAIRSTMGV